MLGYTIRRLLWVVPVVLGATIFTFAVMHAAPGSPWNREGRQLDPVIVERLNQQLGLDQPLPMQYLAWLGRLATGDFGVSTLPRPDRPGPSGTPGSAGDHIGESAWPSIHLGLMAFGLAVALGVPLGVAAAIRHRTVVDYLATGVSLIGLAAPAFVLGAVLQQAIGTPDWRFVRGEGIFPQHGWGTPAHWVLPTLAMAGLPMAYIARVTRASMLDVLHADYVRTAHSKGLTERWIVNRHILRNALVPLTTIAGPMLALLMAGSIAVELTFNIPGLGYLYWNAMRFRDYATVMGITVLYAVAIALLNAAVDIGYGVIDPRMRDRTVNPV